MKYKIPIIDKPNYPIRDRMDVCCERAQSLINADGGCKNILCTQCLFDTSENIITKSHEKQFLAWEAK